MAAAPIVEDMAEDMDMEGMAATIEVGIVVTMVTMVTITTITAAATIVAMADGADQIIGMGEQVFTLALLF